ncbi:VanW family protein [Candidatus Peregrinibacteria bacterium]|nr:VanW family protein [Candidatus Peregrinibacteria bacterium]
MLKRKLALRITRYIGAIIIMLMLFALMVFAKKPSYLIGGVRIDNIDAPDAKTKIENIVNNFNAAGEIKFSYNNKLISVSAAEIGAKWDINKTIDSLRKFRSLRFSSEPISTPVYASIDKEKLIAKIKNTYKDEIKEMSPAAIAYSAGTFRIVSEQSGSQIEEYLLIQETESRIKNLSQEIIPLYFITTPPAIKSEDLAVYFEELKTILRRPIALKYGWTSYTFLPTAHLDDVYYQKEYGAADGEKIQIKLNNSVKKSFIAQIENDINKTTSPIKIYENSSGKIIFEGDSEKGEEVQTNELISLIEDAMNNNKTAVAIPVTETPPRVIASEELSSLGIKELLGIGHTSFHGSPANRIHNIKVGVNHFSGTLIGPGEEFSFNKTLGRVDQTTGYLEELTIKPEGTVPEYGGGLCQVSTTMYRAVIYAGLPVAERSAHSYAVRYYSQIGGHGLDATVYPGSHDLRFINNTPGAILIQSYVRGMEAFYKFYGTSDGRRVEMDGPYLSDFVPAGSKEIIKTLNLPAGQQKQLERAGKGFKALWTRTITYADGEAKKEEIKSSYRATADKVLVGIDPNSEEGKILQQAAQPVEAPLEKQFTD